MANRRIYMRTRTEIESALEIMVTSAKRATASGRCEEGRIPAMAAMTLGWVLKWESVGGEFEKTLDACRAFEARSAKAMGKSNGGAEAKPDWAGIERDAIPKLRWLKAAWEKNPAMRDEYVGALARLGEFCVSVDILRGKAEGGE